MQYDFHCPAHGTTTAVSANIRTGPGVPPRCPVCSEFMGRVWYPPRIQVYYDAPDYIDQAYRGEIAVPGMTTNEVRATVNTMTRSRKRRGRHK